MNLFHISKSNEKIYHDFGPHLKIITLLGTHWNFISITMLHETKSNDQVQIESV